MMSYIYVCNLPLPISSPWAKPEQLESCSVICFEKFYYDIMVFIYWAKDTSTNKKPYIIQGLLCSLSNILLKLLKNSPTIFHCSLA